MPLLTPETGHRARRSTRRLTWARRAVTGSYTFGAGLIVLFAVQAAVVQLGAPEDATPLWVVAAGVVLSVPLAGISLLLLLSRVTLAPLRVRLWTWVSCFLLLAMLGTVWGGFLAMLPSGMLAAGAWWPAVALTAPRRDLWAVTALVLVVPWAMVPFGGVEPFPLAGVMVIAIAFAVLMWLANLSMQWLWDTAREATATRDAQARLAVSEERLRIARDLHDLLGHTLTGIAVKSELASRLAPRDPERAAAEMAAVQNVARDALREVRAAVTGYRDVDLADELDNVRAVLGAAGIRCTIEGESVELPTDQRALAAWIVREGATNVLRHATARRCDVAVRCDGETAVVEIANDGVPTGATRVGAATFGNGLTGLAERAAIHGGTVTAGRDGRGGFLLRAVLPLAEHARGTLAEERASEKRGIPT